VKTVVTATLRDEAARYQLRFGCEDCVHFEAELVGPRGARAPAGAGCSQGWPIDAHVGVELDRVDAVEFCKSFELG
jgi:hypothetical protein